jgi:hypothetical protein
MQLLSRGGVHTFSSTKPAAKLPFPSVETRVGAIHADPCMRKSILLAFRGPAGRIIAVLGKRPNCFDAVQASVRASYRNG